MVSSLVQSVFCQLRNLFAVLLLVQLVACTASSVPNANPENDSVLMTTGKTLVYECVGYEFIARTGPGEMAVWLEERYLILSSVRSASGSKYTEGDVTFWSKGNEAILYIGNQRFDDCTLAPHRAPWEDARRRGVDFRAVGNEPGWVLEIQNDRHLLFIADYGMNRVLIENPVLSVQGSHSIYEAHNKTDTLKIDIVDEQCTDSMKGNTFASQVTLYWNGNTYIGCGSTLVSMWK